MRPFLPRPPLRAPAGDMRADGRAQVKYEKKTTEISVGPDDSAALLQTRIYFETKVLPTRQKLIGFKGVSGQLFPVASARHAPSCRLPTHPHTHTHTHTHMNIYMCECVE